MAAGRTGKCSARYLSDLTSVLISADCDRNADSENLSSHGRGFGVSGETWCTDESLYEIARYDPDNRSRYRFSLDSQFSLDRLGQHLYPPSSGRDRQSLGILNEPSHAKDALLR